MSTVETVKIFAYEHITGGGCAGAALPSGLVHEATAMLRALAADLNGAAAPASQRVSPRKSAHSQRPTDIAVSGLFDHRVVPVIAQHARVHSVEEWHVRFDECVHGADAVWLIAPETHGMLEQLSERVLGAGASLIGSRPDAVRVTASKRATGRVLHADGIPAVPAVSLDELPGSDAAAWVAKPDEGCGCEDTWLFEGMHAAAEWVSLQPEPMRFVLQPYVPGEPLSLSLLTRAGEAWLLSVNRQRIDTYAPAPSAPPSSTGRPGEGWGPPPHAARRLVFRGCLVNALPDSHRQFQRLAQRVVEAIPGLWGYIGIDLILTRAGPVVVDINPRLTTSYVGLSAALGINVAGLVLQLLDSDAPVDLPPAGASARAVEVAAS